LSQYEFSVYGFKFCPLVLILFSTLLCTGLLPTSLRPNHIDFIPYHRGCSRKGLNEGLSHGTAETIPGP